VARLRIGSRGSQLALWQANYVATRLRQRGHEVEIVVIKTTGDKITEVALSRVGTKGMFIQEIEEALDEGGIDLAVHSLKDLPTDLSPEHELAAVTERDDPRDAFVSRHYARLLELPPGARVGTSSLRRQAQLKALRPDFTVVPLRGNVDTRLRKLDSGEFQAIILAAAGLNRLGKRDQLREILPPQVMCPAAGQGALAIEIRAGDQRTGEHVEFLDDASSNASTGCERALLRILGGGCQVPIGAFAQPAGAGSGLELTAVVARPDGSEILRESQRGSEPEALGREVGEALLRNGAERILRQVYGSEAAVPQPP